MSERNRYLPDRKGAAPIDVRVVVELRDSTFPVWGSVDEHGIELRIQYPPNADGIEEDRLTVNPPLAKRIGVELIGLAAIAEAKRRERLE